MSLFLRARDGDRQAFAEVVGLTEPVVRAIVRRWRSAGIDELEVATLVYTETWKGLRSVQAPESFIPWLTRVTVRVAAREARRQRARSATLPEDQLERIVEPAPSNAEWVREFVADLPAECRELVDMKYLREMSLDEIADRTGLRVHRIEYLLRKGRELLRRRITRTRDARDPRR